MGYAAQLLREHLEPFSNIAGGVSACIVVDDSTECVAMGSAREDGSSTTAATWFDIGSITKGFTGLLLATALADSRVALQDRLEWFAPEAAGTSGGAVTIGALATHRAGLPLRPPSCEGNPPLEQYSGVTRESLFDDLRALEVGAGDHDYSYSNFGYALLGVILERVMGDPWGVLIEREVLKALDISEVSTRPREDVRAQPVGRRGQALPGRDISGLVGAGGLWATARGLAELVPMFSDPMTSTLSKALTLALQAHARGEASNDGNEREMGLGWRLLSINDFGRIVWHSGHGPGLHTFFACAPQRNAGVAVLTNHHHTTELDLIALHVLRAVMSRT